MKSLSSIDLGSTLLSIVIAMGFIACFIALLRLTVSGINNIYDKLSARK